MQSIKVIFKISSHFQFQQKFCVSLRSDSSSCRSSCPPFTVNKIRVSSTETIKDPRRFRSIASLISVSRSISAFTRRNLTKVKNWTENANKQFAANQFGGNPPAPQQFANSQSATGKFKPEVVAPERLPYIPGVAGYYLISFKKKPKF